MAKEKIRVALYYGTRIGAALVKTKASLLREDGYVPLIIDASVFDGKLEEVDQVKFIEVDEAVEKRIRDAYEGRAQEIAANTPVPSDEVRIPEDWEDLPFPELQKLAAALSGEAVRSKDAAFEIVAAEVERRCADIDADDDLDADLDQDTDGSEEGGDDDEGDDDAGNGENGAQQNTEAAPKGKRNRRNRR